MTAFEPSSYRGFPLVIHRQTVDVLHPETGRKLAALTSVKQARLFVQGWKREERRVFPTPNTDARQGGQLDAGALPSRTGASIDG